MVVTMAGKIHVTIEPWQGHTNPSCPDQRITWHVDPSNPINVIRKVDAHCGTVAASELWGKEEEYFVCHNGRRYVIVAVTKQDAAKAME